jgi:hypothetical protein
MSKHRSLISFKPLISCSAALLIGLSSAGVAIAQDALTEQQVRARLAEQGYTKVNDVKFKGGVWKADARSAEGHRVDVRIDARTGAVYPDEQVANLSEADVRARLATAGYVDVHDVNYEDGVWNAQAEDGKGRDLVLKLDPATGKVIGKEKD